MNSDYIFAQIDRLKQEALEKMGKLREKLKKESDKIIQENQIDKKDLTYIFKEMGEDVKERLAKLSKIAKKIKQLEEVARVNKRLQLKNLEIQIELFESAMDFGESTENFLQESVNIYEKLMDEKEIPNILRNATFCKKVDNIIRGTENMINRLEKDFDERLENRIKYGGTRPFYMGLKIRDE
ncbi:MAG: hypothetical protein GY749_38200 [Desulfobacteraceae bacterium]|nr:hypothetical protein [Desulfobacteraceae bacterium]